MEKIFNPIFVYGSMTLIQFLICMAFCIICGLIISIISYLHTKSSKGFFVTTAILPLIVAMVIVLVNGNIGAGVAVAGAFSLIRFRSAPGTAKEICIIFIDMACGLAMGMGYIGYGVLFTIIASVLLLVLGKVTLWDGKRYNNDKLLRITVPEDLDYTGIFDDLFDKYLEKYDLVTVKTSSMGSLFKLTYNIKLKNNIVEKEFIDELRIRNGNLEVSLSKIETLNGDIL